MPLKLLLKLLLKFPRTLKVLHKIIPVFSGVVFALECSPGRQRKVLFGMCALTAWALAATGLTDPGRIPPGWDGVVSTFKRNGQRRYCRSCKALKPDRAHHCRQCQKCTLEMHHHDNFVGNCVGFRNLKSHILCHVYGVAAFVLYVSMRRRAVFRTRTSTFALIAMLPVMGMSSFHLIQRLVLTSFGITFIEKREKGVALRQSPYDMGVWGNLKRALGASWYLWLLPLNLPEENGIDQPGCERQLFLMIPDARDGVRHMVYALNVNAFDNAEGGACAGMHFVSWDVLEDILPYLIVVKGQT